MRRMKRVWGWLKFSDGTELDLEGQLLSDVIKDIGQRKIISYGQEHLASEANVFVVPGDKTITGLDQVKKFFQQ